MKQFIILTMLLAPLALNASSNKGSDLLSSLSRFSIRQTESNQPKKYARSTSVEIQNLFSTHGTNFKGVGVVESYKLSPLFSLGLGAEYSWCGYHFDNGWNLTDLKFLPVYADSKMNLTEDKVVTPYLHLSAGLSFANYNIQDALQPGPVSHVSEQGFYMYSGGGVSFKISKHLYSYFDLGFKGYHMSLNALDINPHGVTTKLGLEF